MATFDNESDRNAITQIITGLDKAWARGDAEAFAARFAENAGFTNVLGMVHYGRNEFRERHDAIFKTIYKGSKATLAMGKLRFIRPDVAIADINAELTGYGALPPGIRPATDGVMRTKLQMVFVKEKDGWWITSYHNVPVAPLTPRP